MLISSLYSSENEIDGNEEITEDDESDLLSQIDIKTSLEKMANSQQVNSNPKLSKKLDESNTLNGEESFINQGSQIKGEGGNDALQFPLGVRIKKEVLEDPREENEADDDDLDSDNFDGKHRKIKKRPSLGQRSNISGKLPRQILNKSNSEEDRIEILKKVVSEIPDAGQIWKAVRTRILSQCQIWDLLMDKVLMYSTIYFMNTIILNLCLICTYKLF